MCFQYSFISFYFGIQLSFSDYFSSVRIFQIFSHLDYEHTVDQHLYNLSHGNICTMNKMCTIVVWDK